MNKLTKILMKQAIKREDRRATPLVRELCEMTRYYPLHYLLKCMVRNYDGRETYFERYKDYLETLEIKNYLRKQI